MSVFSDTSGNLGGVQQVRSLMRVDVNMWPTWKIVNSFNNYLDTVTGYAIQADRRFQFDNTQHQKLPEGTCELTINVSDYSFLTDEQGNAIVTLIGVSLLQGGKYVPLKVIDRADINYSVDSFGVDSGTPTSYDKIADNIIRLDKKPSATVAAGLKFYFQRVSPRFAATDTTKETGFSPLLDRGFVIAAAYDGALTLGLKNLQALSVERQYEEQKMITYFSGRNNDEERRIIPHVENTR